MIYLDVFHSQILEIAILPSFEELAPVVLMVLLRALLTDQLFQRFDVRIMRRVEEEWNRKPLLV